MLPDLIIARLGELTLKGRNRGRFENAILRHMKSLLEPYEKLTYQEEFGRVYIDLNGEPYEEIVQRLQKVFGLHSMIPALRSKLDLEDIKRTALRQLRETEPFPRTFKMAVRRPNKSFPYDSQQLVQLVAAYVLHELDGLVKADVHHPEAELRVEVRENEAYVYTTIIPGTGGFPIGTNGKALLMLSGGIDSPVAGYMALRQGLEIEAVHFHSYPFTSERAKQKVIDLAKRLSMYSGRMKLHLVPFTDIQTRLRTDCRENLIVTHMRRAMFRIAEKLAAKSRALAIVTGESLGQVASQTLPSMNVIGQVIRIPVLRPLIMSDKVEIVRMAERVDTYSISILPYEDCCTIFLPKSPSTNPNPETVERSEIQMDWLSDAIEQAVAQTELLDLAWNDREETDEYF